MLAALIALSLHAQTPAPTVATPATPAAPGTVAPAPVPEKCKVVVFNLVGRALAKGEEDLAAILTEAVASEVGPASKCDVTSQADIVAMLDYEKQKAVCTDGSDSCLSEIGQAFGADRVVAGTVSKIASEYIVSAKLMNVKKGAVEQRAEQTVSDPAELRRAAKNVARRLFGAPDLAADAKVAPVVAKSAPEGGGASGLLWTGVVVGGIGVVAAAVGGTMALLADASLAAPKTENKDALHTQGAIELAVAGGGVVALVVGGVLVGVGL